jgi:hypothetical protein
MKKRILGIFASILVVVILTLPISLGYATKPMTVNGELQVFLPGEVTFEQAGNSDKFFRYLMDHQTWTGAIEGDCIQNFMTTPSVGRGLRGYGSYTFESVTVTVGSITVSGSLIIVNLPHLGWRIESGTGELNNLRGHGTFERVGDAPGIVYFNYSGELHFDPQ